MNERLHRSDHERMFLGVCGGIAQRYDLDPTLVRLAFMLLFFVGPGLLVYLLAALIIPRSPALDASARMRAIQESAPTSLSRR